MIVPADAVFASGSGLHVAVVKDGTVQIRTVAVARDLGTEVEVREGVASGDTVILNPMVNLADGSKVRPKTAVAQNKN